MEVLVLSHNKIRNIPDAIRSLVNLKILDVQRNRLRSVSHEIGKLYLLEELLLADNFLSTISPDLGNLKRIRAVYLRNNRLDLVPYRWSELATSLEVLDLRSLSLSLFLFHLPHTFAVLFHFRLHFFTFLFQMSDDVIQGQPHVRSAKSPLCERESAADVSVSQDVLELSCELRMSWGRPQQQDEDHAGGR